MNDSSDFADAPDVVVVERVHKKFVIRRDNSLKERMVTMGRRGRAHREEFESLKDISLRIPAGSSIGLLGPNGSGKSTLLKVIGGIIDAPSGTVQRRGRMAALLELGAGFPPDLSGRDNVYLNASILGLSKEETDARFDDIVAFAEIGDFIDTQVKFYSSGMYVRLAFAVAVHTDPDLLLVDEVLAVGDEAFQRKCMDKIRQFQAEGRTIILVSHSAAQVMEVCDRGVVLSNGALVYEGSAAEATKVHREILEGKRKRAEEDAHHDEPLAAESSLVGIELLDGEGKAVRTISPGDRVTVRLRLEHVRPLESWNTSISIDTPQGQQVFGTGTRRQEHAHGHAASGPHVVDYEIPDLRLAGGQYFINAEVSDAEGAPLDVMWQGATFFVPLDFAQTGTVHAAVNIRVDG